MKTLKTLKFNITTAIVAVMVAIVSLSSCHRIEDPEGGNGTGPDVPNNGEVPYKPCPCEEEQPYIGTIEFPQGGVYLFKDSIPEHIRPELYTSDPVCWIIFYSGDATADMELRNIFALPGYGRICNFPDFAINLIDPENGCKVYIEGFMYTPCWGGIATHIYFDYVLTNLRPI